MNPTIQQSEIDNCNQSSRILVSQHFNEVHGQGKINYEIAKFLLTRGVAIDVYSSYFRRDGDFQGAIRLRNVPVPSWLPTNWLRESIFALQVKRQIGQHGKVDINNGAAVLLPSKLNIAMFVHAAWRRVAQRLGAFNSGYGLYQRFYTAAQIRRERVAFRSSEKVIAISSVVAKELSHFHSISKEKIEVVHPGVDSEVFRPMVDGELSQTKILCGIEQGKPLAIFVGEITTARKNLDIVLKVLLRSPQLHLAVIGDCSNSPYPKLARDLGVSTRVSFLGHRTDVPELLRGSDMLLFPTHYEPFGMVILEAMSSGLPVITTSFAGAADLIKSGVNGIVVDDGIDINGIYDGIQMLSFPDGRERMGKEARGTALECSWGKTGLVFERLLERSEC